MVAPEVITENSIFILGSPFEEICYSQLMEIIFPDIFCGERWGWEECVEPVSFHRSSIGTGLAGKEL